MSRLNNGHLRRHSVSFSVRQRRNGTPSGGKDEMQKKAPTSGWSEQGSRAADAVVIKAIISNNDRSARCTTMLNVM